MLDPLTDPFGAGMLGCAVLATVTLLHVVAAWLGRRSTTVPNIFTALMLLLFLWCAVMGAWMNVTYGPVGAAEPKAAPPEPDPEPKAAPPEKPEPEPEPEPKAAPSEADTDTKPEAADTEAKPEGETDAAPDESTKVDAGTPDAAEGSPDEPEDAAEPEAADAKPEDG